MRTTARRLWPDLAAQIFAAEGGRIFIPQPLLATMIYGIKIVPVVSGEPVRWREVRRHLGLPDACVPHNLVPLPTWIHAAEGPPDSARLRLRRSAAFAAPGLDVLPLPDPR